MVVRGEAPGDWWTPSPPCQVCQASSPGLQLLFRFFLSSFSLPMAAWSPVSWLGCGWGESSVNPQSQEVWPLEMLAHLPELVEGQCPPQNTQYQGPSLPVPWAV